MLNVSNYASFNNNGESHRNSDHSINTRIGADRADVSQQNIQNMMFADHTLTHYYVPTTDPSRITFASEAGLMSSGHALGNGLGATEVDLETELYWGTKLPKDAGKLNLNPRTYVTVPYLGRGSFDTDTYNRLQRGEALLDKRTGRAANSMAALRQPADCPVPLLHRPREQIDEDALDLPGWLRGGVPTRAVTSGDPA